MDNILYKIISYLQCRLCDKNFISRVAPSFNRVVYTRKVSFIKAFLFILFNGKSSMPLELFRFAMQNNVKMCNQGRFSRLRCNISYEAFRVILTETAHSNPKKNLYKGYQIFGTDGTALALPKNPCLSAKYGVDGCSYPQAHAVAVFDVLNKVHYDAEFLPYPTDEREAAISLLERMFPEPKQIFTYDRGFPSVRLIQYHMDNERKFVMRVSKSFLREVNSFFLSDEIDEFIHIDYNKRRATTSGVSGVRLPFSFDVRCVKVVLKSGEVEVLLTNLSATEFTAEDIYKIYGLRWGIETSYNELKNSLIVEQFSALLENSVKQDFYASLILHNLLNYASADSQTVCDLKKTQSLNSSTHTT